MGKIVDWRLYDPANNMFKGKGNDKSKLTITSCDKSDSCDLFKRGECSLTNFWGKCVYGKTIVTTGPTKRSRSYYDFIIKSKNKVEGIKQLSSATTKMGVVGDYVYLPYAHWGFNNPKLDENLQSTLFTNKMFVPKETFFDVEFLNNILTFKPHAIMGGEITDYQKNTVPKMLTHLREVFPELYSDLLLKFPNHKINQVSPIGRKAYIKTLKKGCTINDTNGDLIWDGTNLVSENYKIPFSSLKGKVKKLVIEPDDSDTITIVSEDQVDNETKYKD